MRTSRSSGVIAAVLVAVSPLLASCVKNDVGAGTSVTPNPGCRPSITPTGKTEKQPDSIKASSCKAVVLMCNYCEYNGDGMLKTSGSEPCGTCVGFDF